MRMGGLWALIGGGGLCVHKKPINLLPHTPKSTQLTFPPHATINQPPDVHLQAGRAGGPEGDPPPRVRHPLPHHQVRALLFRFLSFSAVGSIKLNKKESKQKLFLTCPQRNQPPPPPPTPSLHASIHLCKSYARDRGGPQDSMPSVFAMKLRKQLRGKGLEDVRQVSY